MSSVGIEVKSWGLKGERVARYAPGRVVEIARLLADGVIDGVSICSRYGYVATTLDELLPCARLKILIVQDLPDLSLDGLGAFHELRELAIDATKSRIDFALLPKLRTLTAHWRNGMFLHSEKAAISDLSMWKFAPRSKDIHDALAFPNLRELRLMQATIASLEGISKYQKLTHLELHYMRNLESFGQLDLPELKTLIADHCKRLAGYEQLGRCTALRELKIHDSGAMPSVRFVTGLPCLSSFRFINTDVTDGDLTPLLRLSDVMFTQKSHFTHTTNQMNQKNP